MYLTVQQIGHAEHECDYIYLSSEQYDDVVIYICTDCCMSLTQIVLANLRCSSDLLPRVN